MGDRDRVGTGLCDVVLMRENAERKLLSVEASWRRWSERETTHDRRRLVLVHVELNVKGRESDHGFGSLQVLVWWKKRKRDVGDFYREPWTRSRRQDSGR